MSNLDCAWEPGEAGPVLLGSRCTACLSVQFPPRAVCPVCGPGTTIEGRHLSRSGRLYAFTELHQSKPVFPTPYYMGYVDLEEGVRVPARIVCDGTGSLRSGIQVELDSGPISVDASGAPVQGYLFRPVATVPDQSEE